MRGVGADHDGVPCVTGRGLAVGSSTVSRLDRRERAASPPYVGASPAAGRGPELDGREVAVESATALRGAAFGVAEGPPGARTSEAVPHAVRGGVLAAGSRVGAGAADWGDAGWGADICGAEVRGCAEGDVCGRGADAAGLALAGCGGAAGQDVCGAPFVGRAGAAEGCAGAAEGRAGAEAGCAGAAALVGQPDGCAGIGSETRRARREPGAAGVEPVAGGAAGVVGPAGAGCAGAGGVDSTAPVSALRWRSRRRRRSPGSLMTDLDTTCAWRCTGRPRQGRGTRRASLPGHARGRRSRRWPVRGSRARALGPAGGRRPSACARGG
ncbi:hypothetical protein EDF34_0770 [Cellulomonas sp. PhB150]|nr:hypothetical protein EDF34_0770 [Cellulomonas sp. PhB150]